MRVLLTLLFLAATYFTAYTQTCQGPFSSSAESNENIGGGNWTTGNAGSSNDTYDTGPTLSASGSFTNRLVLTGFGFSIPAGATITGIEVIIERSVTGSTIEDNDIMLIKGGVTQTGTDKATAGAWPTTDANATYGSSTDLWGNTWTPADINSGNFGIAISAIRTVSSGPPRAPRTDHVTIRVCYSLVLPLTIKNFTAAATRSNTVQLNWITSQENSVKTITVEKSTNGADYIRLSDIAAKGNGFTGDNSYQFADPLPSNGSNYYRLRITDIDGKYTWSETRTAEIKNGRKGLSLKYVNGTVFVNTGGLAGNYELQAFDAGGRRLFTKTLKPATGSITIAEQVHIPVQGFCYLKLSGNGSSVTEKVWVQ